ncbi:S8 family serine peptidase [Streptomyces sp. NPDC087659]|uniref:S8 family serine peptidase n=1 Tax=Streptomyces sp. NPDC087659 TaxID=3365801 RepID=UPI0038259725
MIRDSGGRWGRAALTMKRAVFRSRPWCGAAARFPSRFLMTALMTAVLAATSGLNGSADAVVRADSVQLPVLPSQLAEGDVCTRESKETASAAPWEQRSLGLNRVWPVATGDGVTVAVVDTGVSSTAATLKGRVTALGAAGNDCVGHGTFVAGLIAAGFVPGVRFAGVAPRARILGVRGTDERGAATSSSVADGIREAADAGADVIQVSPALTKRSDDLKSAVAYAAERDALIVAAAVPDPQQRAAVSTPPPRDYWPAAEPGVISVIDLDAKGGRPQEALLPRSADLSAPGDGVVGIGTEGEGHFIGSGASLAAAYVAGTAALIRSAHPGLSAEMTAERLMDTAYPADVPRLDTYAAVTTARAVSEPAQVQAGPDTGPVALPSNENAARAMRRAFVLGSLVLGMVILVIWAAVIVPRGRARAWRGASR